MQERNFQWLTLVAAPVAAAALFVAARVLDPGTVAVLCGEPPAVVRPQAGALALGRSELKLWAPSPWLDRKPSE